jgi:hypothetical protein
MYQGFMVECRRAIKAIKANDQLMLKQIIQEQHRYPDTFYFMVVVTAYKTAIKANNLKILKYLINNHRFIYSGPKIRPFLVCLAGQRGHLKILKYLVKEWRPHNIFSYLFMPIWWAAYNGHYKVIKYLINDLNQSITGCNSITSCRVLCWAAQGNKSPRIFRFLLTSYRPRLSDKHISRLIMCAARYNRVYILKYLVNQGYSLIPRRSMFEAARYGSFRALRFLVRYFKPDDHYIDKLTSVITHPATYRFLVLCKKYQYKHWAKSLILQTIHEPGHVLDQAHKYIIYQGQDRNIYMPPAYNNHISCRLHSTELSFRYKAQRSHYLMAWYNQA